MTVGEHSVQYGGREVQGHCIVGHSSCGDKAGLGSPCPLPCAGVPQFDIPPISAPPWGLAQPTSCLAPSCPVVLLSSSELYLFIYMEM